MEFWHTLQPVTTHHIPILTPCDSGQLADRLSTYDYALYQYFKIVVYSLENAISGIPLSWKEFRVANAARFRRSWLQTIGPMSSASPQSTRGSYTLEKRARTGRCADETAQPRPSLSLTSQATVLNQPSGLAYIVVMTSHRNGDIIFGGRGPESPNLNSLSLKYGILAEMA